VTVRQKITLLITAAGLISSLVFSFIILREMLEQPFHLIDSELASVSKRAVAFALEAHKKRETDAQWSVGDERYWLEIKDPDFGKSIYRSELAKMIEVPQPLVDSSATVSVTIPRKEVDLGQNQHGEVTFRVRKSKIVFGQRNLIVCAARPIQNLEDELRDTLMVIGSGLVISMLLLTAISYFMAGLILKPVRAINDEARDISEQHLDRRMPVSGGRDEFNALAQTLNKVFDRLQNAFQRQKRLLADASHELKTPLTMMRLDLDKLRFPNDETPYDPQAKSHERMTEQVLRMERLVKSLLDLSALEIESAAGKDRIDLIAILKPLIADYRLLAEQRHIRMKVKLPDRLEIKADAEMLNRAFSNILDNAVKYNTDGGQIEVVGDQSDGSLAITISNTGPGVSEAEIPKVFDQFYRVEQSRSLRYGGAGLGLSIVKRIVELHGGKIELKSQLGGLTQMTVRLPQK
jgi:two-component system, OmpR family, sensor kinase